MEAAVLILLKYWINVLYIVTFCILNGMRLGPPCCDIMPVWWLHAEEYCIERREDNMCVDHGWTCLPLLYQHLIRGYCWCRDLFLLACLFSSQGFALFVPIWPQVRKMGLNKGVMLMSMKLYDVPISHLSRTPINHRQFHLMSKQPFDIKLQYALCFMTLLFYCISK